MVEPTTVNRLVAGSNPARGAIEYDANSLFLEENGFLFST